MTPAEQIYQLIDSVRNNGAYPAESYVQGSLDSFEEKVREEEREQARKTLEPIETIAQDEEEAKFIEHCSCLRYAIWRVDNPDADEMVYASKLSQRKDSE